MRVRSIFSVLAGVAAMALAPPAFSDCYADHCTGQIGARRCYACCNTNCTDAVACQNKCDGSNTCPSVHLLRKAAEGGVETSRPAITALVERDSSFNGPVTDDCGAEGIDWLTLQPDAAIVRLGLSLASDRLISSSMLPAVRAKVEGAIVTGLTDERSASIRTSALLTLQEAGLVFNYMASVLEVALTDPDPDVRQTAIGVLFFARKGQNFR